MSSKKLPEQYINFARKYRPNNFAKLYGQEVLTKVLSYTIAKERIAQGYLLTGIRGVGKTTSARIIAKTINCTNRQIQGQDISACDNCQNCTSFNNNNHPDIIEIDAASKTSVDDVRKIIESSEYKPLIAQYTIYIIDEVHMLSKGAFNALLKILEEPPRHIIFIFATTEPQKIPLTIISRCQRYDLRRLTLSELFQLLQEIADKEQLKIDNEALKIIASRSDGSARDAISLLDQVVGLGQGEIITALDICQIVGLVDTVSIIKFMEAIITKDTAKSLDLLHELYMASANLEVFIGLLSDFIAYLTKLKMLPNYQNPIYEAFSKEIANILSQVTICQLSIIWQIYSKGVMEIKISHNQLIEAEMLAIKSIYCQMLPSIEELAEADNQLAHQLKLPASQESNLHNQILSFLGYLYLHNEMEIYYYLMNEVEIKSFTNNSIELAGKSFNVTIQEQLNNLLLAWSGNAYNIIVTKQLKIITLKEQFIEKVKTSQDWQTLIRHFPDITISDILLDK
ncbi:DNA polymerase III subunit gamma/tau [Candidatus Tisiphia endosymbiont of Nemotelus uliginosus]|uniref:DNA polymerase III subunit gamma/tau n=1 Tax=Candidatus Tisiphia endosymbiont of Nemotelus uliginosus TaxID=3077926 RepID=UPI0035C93AED